MSFTMYSMTFKKLHVAIYCDSNLSINSFQFPSEVIIHCDVELFICSQWFRLSHLAFKACRKHVRFGIVGMMNTLQGCAQHTSLVLLSHLVCICNHCGLICMCRLLPLLYPSRSAFSLTCDLHFLLLLSLQVPS